MQSLDKPVVRDWSAEGKAFNEGWQAAKNREGLASNPYKPGKLSDAFVDGYWEYRETRI